MAGPHCAEVSLVQGGEVDFAEPLHPRGFHHAVVCDGAIASREREPKPRKVDTTQHECRARFTRGGPTNGACALGAMVRWLRLTNRASHPHSGAGGPRP